MTTSTHPTTRRVHRVEVRTKPGLLDPRALAAMAKAQHAGFAGVQQAASGRVYLLEGALSPAQLRTITDKLLVDPVVETVHGGSVEVGTIEVHPLPGVMDPAAQSVREAIRELVGVAVDVSTATRYDFQGLSPSDALSLARASLANPAIHQITQGIWEPAELPKGEAYTLRTRTIPLRGLGSDQLTTLSRDTHLFLNLAEMRAVQAEFDRLGRDPTDIELETIAQTWSEHCVHKTLKATIRYTESPSSQGIKASSTPIAWASRPGHVVHADGSVTITNLLKSTIAAATNTLIQHHGVDWALSVFKDNSGVIAFDDRWGINIKVETHNRPSAIEPYGGAATGIGGCIRDVIATGLGAKPIASTDVFCVADPGAWSSSNPLPPGVLHPRRILTDIVAGVRDYGNRMGIPTVSGGVFFDNRYVGNPLVFCGCVGLIPRHLIHGEPKAGDRIIALGGRTGRDGIHGATFSSAELQSTSASEFSHAVQIGNAIEEKRLLDAVLRARDAGPAPLYSAMTDCGAGGFSSAVGEMAKDLGAFVTLETAPTKYAGLSYTEIWISEAQERVVLAVPAGNVAALQAICDEEHVELCDLGSFATPTREIVLTYASVEVGRLSTHFLHEGLPNPTREAVWRGADERASLGHVATADARTPSTAPKMHEVLLALLAHPSIASKHWIIRQYDHEVQGATLIKPLVGPLTRGPGDAAVLQPIASSTRGIALSQGLQTPFGDVSLGGDPYWMTLASIDECVRNLVCVGADPSRIAILDNFCWASCDKPENLGALVRAAEACYDGALAYKAPFVSGKDSLSNQLRYTDPRTGEPALIEIPPTLLITGLAIVPDVTRCVTMDAKRPGSVLLLVGPRDSNTLSHGSLGASFLQQLANRGSVPNLTPATIRGRESVPHVSLTDGPRIARVVAGLMQRGLVLSAHDCSEGGALVAIAEMLIAGSSPRQPIGCICRTLDSSEHALDTWFGEGPSRYLLEVDPARVDEVRDAFNDFSCLEVGTLTNTGKLAISPSDSVEVESLAQAWLSPLDW
jgi:phosphoribosylformylglycinamidine synthase subunit PurSL